jgi:hypothetical protein
MKKRGQPARPRHNIRLTAEEIAAELERHPEGDPLRELLDDGQGIDFRLPDHPWSERDHMDAQDNLAILRVDPKASNFARLEAPIVRAIAGLEFEFYDIGKYFGEMIADWPLETVERHFADILRLKKYATEPPHRNYIAYRAYCDFLSEFGFNPSMPRLTEFIRSNPRKYPVGIDKPPGGKEWWQMFFEAGLVRLAE